MDHAAGRYCWGYKAHLSTAIPYLLEYLKVQVLYFGAVLLINPLEQASQLIFPSLVWQAIDQALVGLSEGWDYYYYCFLLPWSLATPRQARLLTV